tara:strand:+ start:8292 stop:8576 length:285 start_codon:yes stop_codon:yes gene_type:complete
MRIYNNFLEEFKNNQLGYSAIAIIGQSCLGSVAAMMILKSEVSKFVLLSELFLVTIICMLFNAAVLAQLSTKVTFNLLILSVLFCSVLIGLHLL